MSPHYAFVRRFAYLQFGAHLVGVRNSIYSLKFVNKRRKKKELKVR